MRAEPAVHKIKTVAVAPEILDRRALGRALLARQMLLERHDMPAEAAIERLVGMQAQAPLAPYVGLWTRLRNFQAGELAGLIEQRRAVRIHVMRGTIHLLTSREALALRGLLAPMLERQLGGTSGRHLAGVDVDELLGIARALLQERPRTRVELRRALVARWPERDVDSLSYAVVLLLPLVQAPPRGVWGATGQVTWVGAESWLKRRMPAPLTPAAIVRRYLAAYGPATVADVQAWSGLTRLREVIERLRPRLLVFADEAGHELFDLPDAPRPHPDTAAPPRFLPEYDNVLFAHADRTRVNPEGHGIPLPPGNGAARGTVLIDGAFRAVWRLTRERDAATIRVEPLARLTRAQAADVRAEGRRLLAFLAPDAGARDVSLTAPPRPAR